MTASPASRCPRCKGTGMMENEGRSPLRWKSMTCTSCNGSGLNTASRIAAELAEQLAFKLNHPHLFADGVRTTFDRYVELVGDENLTDEVRRAREI